MGVNEILDNRPLIVAVVGPNGAGKSTFYHAYLALSGLHFINADKIALELAVDAYTAAKLADVIRRQLVEQRDSFIFETVFSDPVGDKIAFLQEAERAGYCVVLFFIGISSRIVSEERVAMRVLKGGHDVPTRKIFERYDRVMANLQRSLHQLSNVRVYDNSDLRDPYRLVATRENGQSIQLHGVTPDWLSPLLPSY